MESGNKKNRKNKEGSRKKSPWDPLERKKLSFEDLKDLNKSFEEDLKVMLQEDKERAEKRLKDKGIEDIQKTPRKRRDSFQDMPVWKAKDIPDGWNPIENDLADDDIDAQIDRCFERLEECIMPRFFEQRLQSLILKKEQIMKKKSLEDPTLRPLEAARVANLEALWELLRDKGDPDEQLVNIENILLAYRDGTLRWTGLITYWSHGKKICEPRPWTWNEFEVINQQFKGSKSFWTEGLDGPGSEQANYSLVIRPSAYHQTLHTYRVAFRLPGFQWYEELEVLYDTGATMARIYEQDVLDLQGPLDTADSKIRVIGSVRSQELTGYTGDRVIEMEVCLLNHRDPTIRETQWMRIQCAVAQGICPTDEPKRLDGPWLRWIMYNAFVPKSNEIRIGSMTTTVTSLSDAPQRRAHKPPTLPADGAPAPYTLQVASSWKPQDG